MVRRKSRRQQRETAADKDYIRRLHNLPCYHYRHVGGCGGVIEQSHERSHTGLGLKAPVHRSWAFCSEHHRQWEEHRGEFRGWSREERCGYAEDAIEWTHGQLLTPGGIVVWD